ncbi:Hypothetical predicted protein [Cloeon dipterum]|uniref:Uncharacterized protein n=1 Tax=Cloeon dipterum TaxID=197152 RepID=A0A8S1E996_9INSE|nr:Hypothetical predicted protein [Cloeon dipterum]
MSPASVRHGRDNSNTIIGLPLEYYFLHYYHNYRHIQHMEGNKLERFITQEGFQPRSILRYHLPPRAVGRL